MQGHWVIQATYIVRMVIIVSTPVVIPRAAKFKEKVTSDCALMEAAKPRAMHWLADSKFPAQYPVKNVISFSDLFTEKNGEIFKAFSPLFNFLLNFSPRTRKVVKMFWVFHLVSS
jgi:hypothetical protein